MEGRFRSGGTLIALLVMSGALAMPASARSEGLEFEQFRQFNIGPVETAVEVGDVTGDDLADAVVISHPVEGWWGPEDAELTVMEQRADGRLHEGQSMQLQGAGEINLVDIDGDEDEDVVFLYNGLLAMRQENGLLQPPAPLPVVAGSASVP